MSHEWIDQGGWCDVQVCARCGGTRRWQSIGSDGWGWSYYLPDGRQNRGVLICGRPKPKPKQPRSKSKKRAKSGRRAKRR